MERGVLPGWYEPRKLLQLRMSWYRIANGRLEYRGRITRAPLAAWLRGDEGAAVLEAAAGQLRVRFFARTRAARRLWRAVERSLSEGEAIAALQQEAIHFGSVVAGICYAPSLPRAQVALHRLVVVPKTMIAGRARGSVRKRLWHRALAKVPDGLRAFLCEQILLEMDGAIRSASPSPGSPIEAREGWMCVASTSDYTWVDPLWSGRGWTGHLVMYEMPRPPLSRALRKELVRAVAEIQSGLSSLSKLQRQSIVRAAADGLPA